jgi:hypothetical protein
MIPEWQQMDWPERQSFRAVVAFLTGRMEERQTVEWALEAPGLDDIEQAAVANVLNNPSTRTLHEPWLTTWSLIEEQWKATKREEQELKIYGVKNRIAAGERSQKVVDMIVDLVSPYVTVELAKSSRWHAKKPRKGDPKEFSELVHAKLSSSRLVNAHDLGIKSITSSEFLRNLCLRLDYAVESGLERARQLGWGGQAQFWRLGGLSRVRYIAGGIRRSVDDADNDRDSDPDSYHTGIAPCVKLLDAALNALFQQSASEAALIANRWFLATDPVHKRLWASAARETSMANEAQVGSFLAGCSDREFWDLHGFPEVAELRCARFHSLNPPDQAALTKRIRKGPPSTFWQRSFKGEELRMIRRYAAAREMRRLQLHGISFSASDERWLAAQAEKDARLSNMSKHDGLTTERAIGFKKSKATSVDYDALSGKDRLEALESALTAKGDAFDYFDNSASTWLTTAGNISLAVRDLAGQTETLGHYPALWNLIGWRHTPQHLDGAGFKNSEITSEAYQVLKLISLLPEDTIAATVEALADWLSSWQRQNADQPVAAVVWKRLWPHALEAVKSEHFDGEIGLLDSTEYLEDRQQERVDYSSLNTAVGKLTGVFLQMLPSLSKTPRKFPNTARAREIFNLLKEAEGNARLVIYYRFYEHLSYFMLASPTWSERELIAPLVRGDDDTLLFWSAVARRSRDAPTIKILGEAMAARVSDVRIPREARRNMTQAVVLECLWAYAERREPRVPPERVTQMLRTIDDAGRADAANIIQAFVRENSHPDEDSGRSARPAEDLVRTSVRPFLAIVWPKERSLVSPGLARAFADLPAVSGAAFAEALDAVRPFLTPFDAWSTLDYGFYDEQYDRPSLSMINTEQTAEALLALLDLTIGQEDHSVVPYDLASALDAIELAKPALKQTAEFGRLAARTR